jgi:hypothetical protein
VTQTQPVCNDAEGYTTLKCLLLSCNHVIVNMKAEATMDDRKQCENSPTVVGDRHVIVGTGR